MSERLLGKPVSESISQRTKETVAKLKQENIVPTLAVFKVGNRDADVSYEKGIIKRCEEYGIKLLRYEEPEDISPSDFYGDLAQANADPDIHGILVFRPLPDRFNDDELRNMISPAKDVDGCTDLSLAGVFTDKPLGFIPCTAQAVMEIIDYYGIETEGKNVVVVGRSLVIGKPVAMCLLKTNATVSICHSKTRDLPEITSKADILIAASGQMEMIKENYIHPQQIIIDVGISWNENKGKLCGDVDSEVYDKVQAVTPVPGGVGSVTTAVLIDHVAQACMRTKGK